MTCAAAETYDDVAAGTDRILDGHATEPELNAAVDWYAANRSKMRPRTGVSLACGAVVAGAVAAVVTGVADVWPTILAPIAATIAGGLTLRQWLRRSDVDVGGQFRAEAAGRTLAERAGPHTSADTLARAIWMASTKRDSSADTFARAIWMASTKRDSCADPLFGDTQKVWEKRCPSGTALARVAALAETDLAGRVTAQAQRYAYGEYDTVTPAELARTLRRALDIEPADAALGQQLAATFNAGVIGAHNEHFNRNRRGRVSPCFFQHTRHAVAAVQAIEAGGPAAVRVAAALADTAADLDTLVAAALELTQDA